MGVGDEEGGRERARRSAEGDMGMEGGGRELFVWRWGWGGGNGGVGEGGGLGGWGSVILLR